MNNKTNEYAMAVAEAIIGLFKHTDEEYMPQYHFDLEKINATEFFTGMVIGCNYVFNKLTSENKNNLEFTYLCNHLIVQNLLAEKKK